MPELRIKMGSSKPRVDVIVFQPGKPHQQLHAYFLLETKKPGTNKDDKKDGIGQLQSYMTEEGRDWYYGDCHATGPAAGRSVTLGPVFLRAVVENGGRPGTTGT